MQDRGRGLRKIVGLAALITAVGCGSGKGGESGARVQCGVGAAGACESPPPDAAAGAGADARAATGGAPGSGGAGGARSNSGGAEAGPGGPRDAAADVCADASCSTACGSGETSCGGACVDLATNPAHCGSCDHDCGGLACSGGVCSGCSPVAAITEVPARVGGSLAGATDLLTLSCGTGAAPERLYTFTAKEAGTYVVGTPGKSTVVAILEGCGGATLACEPEGGRYSSTAFIAAGQTVAIVVEGAAGTGGFDLRIRKNDGDPCCETHDTPGCGNKAIEDCVCAVAPGCCTGQWSATCDALVNTQGCGLCRVDRPPSCGATDCSRFDATAAFLGVSQCCTTASECGAFFGGRCVARDQHGARDAACPTEQVGSVRAPGCCRPDGRCGVDLAGLDMGCVAREDAPGASLSKVTCGGASKLPDFRNFESDQVRPLSLSPDGSQLFAVNTPDDRLEIYSVGAAGLTHTASVVVGLDPVAVAARTSTEVWVVNEVSDSVSIVDVGVTPPRVSRTLWVGDEPRDIVFGGPGGKRAFITTAHRGQNHPVDPQLLTPGVGRADVWVFAVDALGPALGGAPETIVNLFGDTPRGLAVTPDGGTVFAAVYHSGNRTTIINEASIGPDSLPPPTANVEGISQPAVGLVVKFDGTNWVDETGHSWSDRVRFTLPDYDVFAIDAAANPPVPGARFSGVGTTLFNLAVNPKTAAIYVSNTEAHNEVRFESGVRARSTDSRITVISGSQVTPRNLNPHIDYSVASGSAAERSLSVGLPTGLAVSADGASVYVAATGSAKIERIDAAALEAGSFAPSAADQITLSSGGPTGLVLDEARGRLYALTRFDDGISIVDLASRAETGHVRMPNPEPFPVTDGRPVLYDTTNASAHGDLSCFTCHMFGDTDFLSWDLGNPSGKVSPDRNPGGGSTFHPMKGPMATQSLRGLAGEGPMHWRGDRSGALVTGSTFQDTNAAFHQFNGAFVTLLGRDSQLPTKDMQRFADFVMTLTYPPNPVRALDDSLTAAQKSGHDLFMNRSADIISTCNGCHVTDVTAGFFGTDGRSQFDAEPQIFKVPHLRNDYQKVGMFGMSSGLGIPSTGFMGDQIRGFGYSHDGSVDTLVDFLRASIFSLSDQDRVDLANLLLAFDSNLSPIVGQQVTLDASTVTSARPRLALLVQEGLTTLPRPACDLVAHGMVAGEARGYLLRSDGKFTSDRALEPALSATDVFTLATDPTTTLTFTCMPPGSGVRAGIDRDRDGKLDRDEIDAGTDPADPAS